MLKGWILGQREKNTKSVYKLTSLKKGTLSGVASPYNHYREYPPDSQDSMKF